MILLSVEQKEKLRQQWYALIRPIAEHAEYATEVWQVLERHYSEGHRDYHNLSHIQALLAHAENFKHLVRQPAVLLLSIWFHDLVYDSKAHDNELKSAQLAEKWLTKLGIDSAVIQHVQQSILATARHEIPQAKVVARDLPLFLDLDLAILGSPPEFYLHYTQAIRNEYRWVPAPLYRSGRLKVIKRLAERDHLYFTTELCQAFEAQARENLKHEIKKLSFFSKDSNDG